MCSVSDIPIVGILINQILEATIGAVKREFCYLLYYKDNVENLKVKIRDLEILERRIDNKVNSERDNGKKIYSQVEKWQEDVKQSKREMEEFLTRYEERKSWKCFNVLRFPNLYSRFQLGREAVKNTGTETGLIDLGQYLVDREIADPLRFTYADYQKSSTGTDSAYMEFESREDAFKKIWEALTKQDGSAVLGIFGMPGVGKTKLMEEVSKKAAEEKIFDEVTRADVGQVVNIQKIQKQLASCLRLELPLEAIEEQRALLLKNRLKNGKKILVLLDDVWEKIPLETWGIPFGDCSIKGCKILLTSRKLLVCIHNNCEDPVKIEPLKVDEAWDLFTNSVGQPTIKSLNDESLARKVCAECAGLPLVIDALGKALKSKPDVSWKDALHLLERSNLDAIEGVPAKVYNSLEWSFNHLRKDAKTCLLICSMFKEDAKIPIKILSIMVIGTGLLKDFGTLEKARIHIDSVIFELKSSSLLLEGGEGSVKLHDIIRDVARSIAANDEAYAFYCGSHWPRQDDCSPRKLICVNFQRDNVDFRDDLVWPNLHMIWLEFQGKYELPDEFFNGFMNLRFLLLFNCRLAPSLGNLANLRTLYLFDCKISDISVIILLKKLEMLTFSGCELPEPLDFRELKCLRMLDLIYCNIVMLRHVLSSLSKLEEVFLPTEFKIWDESAKKESPISHELSKLTRLTNLEIHLNDAMSFSDENFWKNLLRYQIFVGKPFSRWDTVESKSLVIRNNSLEGVGRTLLERSEQVYLKNVKGLQNCFSNDNGEAFVDLKILRIDDCIDADHLLGWIPQNQRQLDQSRSFSRLTCLVITGSRFKYLFSASIARCLHQLQVLHIADCWMMEEILRNESPNEDDMEILIFPKLGDVILSGLSSLTSFCSRYRNMSSTKMENTSIPASQSLFNGMVAFDALKTLSIDGLDKIEYVFNEKVVFPALENLEVWNLENVIGIWTSQQPHREDSFSRLKSFSVTICNKLENVIPFPMLQRLKILESLSIKDCESLISEFEGPSNGGEITKIAPITLFPRLRVLLLSNLPRLTKIGLNSWKFPPEITNTLYPNLNIVTIVRCNNLRNVFLPLVVRHLVHLKELIVDSCSNLKEIIATIEEDGENINDQIAFPMLNTLRLKNLPRLDGFWCHESVEPPNIDRPQSLLGHKVAFPSLVTFYFEDQKIKLA